MPSEKSARRSQRKRIQNRYVRSATRTAVSTAISAIKTEDTEVKQSAVTKAIRSLDKASKRGVIHHNNAARKKSRLMKKLNSSMKEN